MDHRQTKPATILKKGPSPKDLENDHWCIGIVKERCMDLRHILAPDVVSLRTV